MTINERSGCMIFRDIESLTARASISPAFFSSSRCAARSLIRHNHGEMKEQRAKLIAVAFGLPKNSPSAGLLQCEKFSEATKPATRNVERYSEAAESRFRRALFA